MLVLIDIPDNERGASFLKRTKELSYVQTVKKMTVEEADVLAEVAEIKKAHRLAAKVKAGKLKTRSAKALLDEL
jgi:hypothetical protein